MGGITFERVDPTFYSLKGLSLHPLLVSVSNVISAFQNIINSSVVHGTFFPVQLPDQSVGIPLHVFSSMVYKSHTKHRNLGPNFEYTSHETL